MDLRNISLDEFQQLSKDAWEASSAGLKLSDWQMLSPEVRDEILADIDYGHGRKPRWLPDLIANIKYALARDKESLQ